MRRLKEIYPNAVNITRKNRIVQERESVDHTKISIDDLFKDFHKVITDEEPSPDTIDLFNRALEMSNEEIA